MGLQSSNLVMVGLGVLGDVPPVADQPQLADGVHLRWTVPRGWGFPWYGFYLYRRAVRERPAQTCLAPALDGRPQVTARQQLNIGDGQLTGSVPLVFTDDFLPTGQIEIDLRGQSAVVFQRPASRPMQHLRVTIGLRKSLVQLRCYDFGDLSDLVRLPLKVGDLTLARVGRGSGSAAVSREADGAPVLALDGPVAVTLAEHVNMAELEFDAAAGTVVMEAFDAAGKRVEISHSADRGGRTKIQVKGVAIASLRLKATKGILKIFGICFGRFGSAAVGPILVEALDLPAGLTSSDSIVVGSATATGAPGDIVTVELQVARATGVRVSGGAAAIVDICWSEVARNAVSGWDPVPRCPQPLTLPVRHPDYPAWTGAVDLALAENEALARVRYGPAGAWAGAPFKDLHDTARRLVEGGPAAGPMDSASRAATNVAPTPLPGEPKTPNMPSIHPLDMLMLGSLHPPIAEMLGLGWTDDSVKPNISFDYMVVADRDGVSSGDPLKLLKYLSTNGFDAATDAWILLDQRRHHQPPLASPSDVKAYALPGGPVSDSAGGYVIAAGAAAVDWRLDLTPAGWLDPSSPVMHHVYRGEAGIGANPAVLAEATTWLTKDQPLLRVTQFSAPLVPPSTPPNWPPFETAFLDPSLGEGWYVYQPVAVDIFGRFSPKSPFAAWWQWAPPPNPLPWYYSGAGAKVVNPTAVRILDKTRPPIPLGVESYVLDPLDPILVKDAAYDAWRTSLGQGGDGTIGLRVRWSWSPNQQQRAPQVSEFRLYWSDGSPPPPGWAEPAAWPDRFFVCPYASDATLEADGTRRYDVFLPQPGGGPLAAGVPLAPDVANPIAYANVSVTASDDAALTADRWPGAGPFAGRAGNESQCAPPARVFRVNRAPPKPPEAIVDSPRVYATPANWHGRSFHTHRWNSQPSLFAHVWRAIDEAVFEADWAAQPRGALGSGDSAFPDAAAEPIWNQAKKVQVAAEIDAIGPLLPGGPSAEQKAASKQAAFALYRSLSDDALRVLANRAGNEKAFVQVTVRALAAADAPDLRGPDDAENYVPSPSRGAFTDEVDGRATNRLLYRTMFVDAAQNRSPLGPCGTAVRLPDVVAPSAPVIAKALGGDREMNLSWASNREPDLAEYRLYWADNERDARDILTMAQVATVAADPVVANRPAIVQWTQNNVPGLKDFWYRVVAVDTVDPDPRGGGGNVSVPSPAIRARAYDSTSPVPPAITAAEWVLVDAAGAVFPYASIPPPGAPRFPAISLAWPDLGTGTKVLVQAIGPADNAFKNLSGWLAPGTTSFVGRSDRPFEELQLRLKVVNAAGNANDTFLQIALKPA